MVVKLLLVDHYSTVSDVFGRSWRNDNFLQLPQYVYGYLF